MLKRRAQLSQNALRQAVLGIGGQDELFRLGSEARTHDGRPALSIQTIELTSPVLGTDIERLEEDIDDATTTLTEGGAKREFAQHRCAVAAEAIEGDARTLILELAAADRADRIASCNEHLGA